MAGRSGKRNKPAAGGKGAGARFVLLISADERQYLIEDVAQLRAGRHRPEAAGNYRREDYARAKAEIDAVLKPYKRRKGGSK